MAPDTPKRTTFQKKGCPHSLSIEISRQKFVLPLLRERHEPGRKATYPHYQVLMSLRVNLGIQQILAVLAVDLDCLKLLPSKYPFKSIKQLLLIPCAR